MCSNSYYFLINLFSLALLSSDKKHWPKVSGEAEVNFLICYGPSSRDSNAGVQGRNPECRTETESMKELGLFASLLTLSATFLNHVRLIFPGIHTFTGLEYSTSIIIQKTWQRLACIPVQITALLKAFLSRTRLVSNW